MMRRMTWLVVMALVGVMGFAGAAFGQNTAGVAIEVDSGHTIGFSGGDQDVSFSLFLSGDAGAPFVYDPPANDDGVVTINLDNLLWSVLLDHGVSHARITMTVDNGVLTGGGTSPENAVELLLRAGALGCLSEDAIAHIGQPCGDVTASIDVIDTYLSASGQSRELVGDIPNSYTGTGADDGLELQLEFQVTNWDLLRAGEVHADLVFEVRYEL